MSEPEARRAAEWLAAHAVLLLGLGLALGLAALAAVAGAVWWLRRHQSAIRARVAAMVLAVRRVEPIDRWLTRSSALVPNAYLAAHLVLGLALTAAVAVFVVIAEEVAGGGDIVAFDLALAQALRDAATPGWERFFAVVTWFGSGRVLALATAVVAVHLTRAGKGRIAAGFAAAQAGGGILTVVLKETFERTRPAFADPAQVVMGWSFPSGHAMGTFIFVGLGAYLLLRETGSWTKAAAVAAAALAWCIGMAFSRLYLGVHFASDVVAGLVAGVAWVAVCASAFEVVRRRASFVTPT